MPAGQCAAPERARPAGADPRQSPACSRKKQPKLQQPRWVQSPGGKAGLLVLSKVSCASPMQHLQLATPAHRASISTSKSTHSCRMAATSRPSPPPSPASAESAAATVRASISCQGRHQGVGAGSGDRRCEARSGRHANSRQCQLQVQGLGQCCHATKPWGSSFPRRWAAGF